MDKVHTTINEVFKHAAVKAFFTGDAYYLEDQKKDKLSEDQDSKQDHVRHLIRSSTFTLPIALFVRQQAERAVASQAECR